MLVNIEKSSGVDMKKPVRIITTGTGHSVKPKKQTQKAKQADNALLVQRAINNSPSINRCLARRKESFDEP